MNKNIFVELTCASTIQNVLVEKRDGVTWLRSSIDVDTPSPRPLCVNVLVKIDDLISDFFELATLIEKNIDLSKYVPMYVFYLGTNKASRSGQVQSSRCSNNLLSYR